MRRIIEKDAKQYQQYVDALAASGMTAIHPAEPLTLSFAQAQITLLPPQQAAYEQSNDYSILAELVYGQTRFLFAGDAESVRLQEYLSGTPHTADVLKVPHHGRWDALSDDFFKAVMPRYAVITCDSDNMPDQQVLDALKALGAEVHGTVYGDVMLHLGWSNGSAPPRSVSETARRTPAETIAHIETGSGGRHAPAAAGGVQRCGVAAALAQLAGRACTLALKRSRPLDGSSWQGLSIPSFYNLVIGKGAKPIGLAPRFAYELYLAKSAARVSRMTLTLIWPGILQSRCSMRLTISLAPAARVARIVRPPRA